MANIEERLRRLETQRGWRGWLKVPLVEWPDYACNSLLAALPGAMDQLPGARLDELIAILKQAEADDNAGTHASNQKD